MVIDKIVVFMCSLRLLISTALILLLMLESGRVVAQTSIWNGGGADDNWSTIDNWQGMNPPVPGNFALLIFAGSDRKSPVNDISGVTLKTLSFSGSGWDLSGNALTFITDASDAGISLGTTGTTNTIRNDIVTDVILKISGGGELNLTGDITGTGMVSIQSDTSVTGSINSTGDVRVEKSVTLDGSIGPGGILNLSGAGGTFPILNGTGVVSRNVNFATNASINSSGTLTIDGTLTVPVLNFTNLGVTSGVIDVSGLTSFSSTFTIASGATLSGTGDIDQFGNVASLDVSGVITAEKAIQFFGTGVIHGDGGVIHGPVTFKEFGRIRTNTNGQTMTFNDDVTLEDSLGNFNTLTIGSSISASSVITMNGNLLLNNATQNTLDFVTLAGTGDIFIGPNAQLRIGQSAVSTITAEKEITLNGRIYTHRSSVVNADIRANDGSWIQLQIGDATSFGGNMFFNDTTLLTSRNDNHTSTFDGVLTVETGTLTVDVDVSVRGAGSIVIQDGAILLNNGSIELPLTAQGVLDGGVGNTLTNSVILEAGTASGTLDLNSTLTVQTIGESNLVSGADVDVEGLTSIAEGTLVVEDSAMLVGIGDVTTAVGAELRVNGIVGKDIVIEPGGLLSGNGIVIGDVTVNGILGPGNSAGDLDLDGCVVLTKTSTTNIELGGTTGGTDYDQIIITGDLNLGGYLFVTLINGFRPPSNQMFIIIDVGGLASGLFEDLNEGDVVTIVDGIAFVITYQAGDGNDVGLITEAVIAPALFVPTRGDHVAGSVLELAASDDMDVSIRRRASDLQSVTEFELFTINPIQKSNQLSIVLEGSVFARSPVSQSIELFNYGAGVWEQVDIRIANQFSDSVANVPVVGDISRFIEPNTREMRAKVRFQSSSQRQAFTSNTDLFSWRVR